MMERILRSPTRVYERSQVVPLGREEAFEFFGDARNLEEITPPSLHFRILEAPDRLKRGSLISYELRLHGVPFRWRTRIVLWEPPARFIDLQIRGPYALWEHAHVFEEVEGGTRIDDRVRYRQRLGVVGDVADALFARRDLRQIFDYRQERVRSHPDLGA